MENAITIEKVTGVVRRMVHAKYVYSIHSQFNRSPMEIGNQYKASINSIQKALKFLYNP